MTKRRIGVFGGSFSPPHLGHLHAAKQFATMLRLDKLYIIPAYHSPGKVMDGTPAQVFQRAEELLEMGLNIPQVTRVFLELKKMGAPVEPVYTIEQAVAAIKKLKGGNR